MKRPDNDVDGGYSDTVRHDRGRSATEVADLEHHEVRELLSDFDGEGLPPGDQERVAEHLEWCRPCRNFLSTLRATVRLLDDLRSEEAPSAAKQKLLDRLSTR